MSVEIKASFLKDLERNLSDKITAASMQSVLSSVSDVLEHYEFSRMLRTDDACCMDLFETWIAAKKVEGCSQKTIAAYTMLITRFLRDLQTPIRNITVYHIRAWLTKEKERGVSESTLRCNRDVFSSMFGWLWREGLIEKNPIANIGPIRVQKKFAKHMRKLKSKISKQLPAPVIQCGTVSGTSPSSRSCWPPAAGSAK